MAKEKTEIEVEPTTEASECPPFTILRTVVYGETAYQPGQEAELRRVMNPENFFALLDLGAIARV